MKAAITVSTTHTRLNPVLEMARQTIQIDSNLPAWARRTNPIVRRELGIYWRTFVPQLDSLGRWYAVQGGIILLTVQFPNLFTPILMMLLISMMMLPIAFVYYVRLLAEIIADSVASITNEFENDTLMLLRVTPISVRHILLSKSIAALWRRMEGLDLLLSASLFLGTPVIALSAVVNWSPESNPLVPQSLILVLILVSMVRLPLEMFMVSLLAITMGAIIRARSTAIIVTAALTFFYFLLLNLPRLMTLSLPMTLLVEALLPVMLPLLLIWTCLKGTTYFITRD